MEFPIKPTIFILRVAAWNTIASAEKLLSRITNLQNVLFYVSKLWHTCPSFSMKIIMIGNLWHLQYFAILEKFWYKIHEVCGWRLFVKDHVFKYLHYCSAAKNQIIRQAFQRHFFCKSQTMQFFFGENRKAALIRISPWLVFVYILASSFTLFE